MSQEEVSRMHGPALRQSESMQTRHSRYFSRWVSAFGGLLLMLLAGCAFTFGVYSNALKTNCKLSQSQVGFIGFAGNFGAYIPLPSVFYNRFGVKATILWGGAVMSGGFLVLYATLSDWLPQTFWLVVTASICAGHGSGYLDHAVTQVSLSNFPEEAGQSIMVTAMKTAAFALGSGVMTEYYSAFLSPHAASFPLMLGAVIGVFALLCAPVTNIVPPRVSVQSEALYAKELVVARRLKVLLGCLLALGALVGVLALIRALVVMPITSRIANMALASVLTLAIALLFPLITCGTGPTTVLDDPSMACEEASLPPSAKPPTTDEAGSSGAHSQSLRAPLLGPGSAVGREVPAGPQAPSPPSAPPMPLEEAAPAPAPLSPSEVPNEFLCPITMELMDDPVVISSGHTFERAAITDWLLRGGGATSRKCPKSGQQVDASEAGIRRNHALHAMIQDWREKHVVASESQEGQGSGACSASDPPPPQPQLRPAHDTHDAQRLHAYQQQPLPDANYEQSRVQRQHLQEQQEAYRSLEEQHQQRQRHQQQQEAYRSLEEQHQQRQHGAGPAGESHFSFPPAPPQPSTTRRRRLKTALVFVCIAIGVGAGLSFVTHLGQLVVAHRGGADMTGALVVLYGPSHALGHILFKSLGSRHMAAAPCLHLLAIAHVAMALVHVVLAYASVSWLYVLTCAVGIVHGGHVSIVPHLQTHLSGAAHTARHALHGAVHSIAHSGHLAVHWLLHLASTTGSLLFGAVLVPRVYEAHVDDYRNHYHHHNRHDDGRRHHHQGYEDDDDDDDYSRHGHRMLQQVADHVVAAVEGAMGAVGGPSSTDSRSRWLDGDDNSDSANTTCLGPECFRASFLWIAGCCFASSIAAYMLYREAHVLAPQGLRGLRPSASAPGPPLRNGER